MFVSAISLQQGAHFSPVRSGLALVPMADAMLLVAKAGATTRGSLRETRHQLDQVDARLLGAVLTSVDPSAHPYGTSYYHYTHKRPTDDGQSAPSRERSTELHPLSAES